MDTKNLLPISFFIIYILATSCSANKKEIYGCYVAVDFENSIDTICLYSDNSYQRKISSNDTLLYSRIDSFTFKNNVVEFQNFYQNNDVDLVKFPESVLDNFGSRQVLIERNINGIYFCTGHRVDEFCYTKVR